MKSTGTTLKYNVISLGIVASAMCAACQGSPVQASSADEAEIGKASESISALVDFHRLYNGNASDHFYTTSMNEAFSASNIGYKHESVIGRVFSSAAPGTVPLYRLNNSAISDHFYTTNSEDRDIAVSSHGYSSEGTACWIFPTQESNTCPLYRLYSNSATDHFYTTSWKEALNATAIGYSYEGKAGYILPPDGEACPD